MVEKPNQITHANEGAEESERGSDQVREWGPWVSPTQNWIKRGHVRAEAKRFGLKLKRKKTNIQTRVKRKKVGEEAETNATYISLRRTDINAPCSGTITDESARG